MFLDKIIFIRKRLPDDGERIGKGTGGGSVLLPLREIQEFIELQFHFLKKDDLYRMFRKLPVLPVHP